MTSSDNQSNQEHINVSGAKCSHEIEKHDYEKQQISSNEHELVQVPSFESDGPVCEIYEYENSVGDLHKQFEILPLNDNKSRYDKRVSLSTASTCSSLSRKSSLEEGSLNSFTESLTSPVALLSILAQDQLASRTQTHQREVKARHAISTRGLAFQSCTNSAGTTSPTSPKAKAKTKILPSILRKKSKTPSKPKPSPRKSKAGNYIISYTRALLTLGVGVISLELRRPQNIRLLEDLKKILTHVG